MASNEEDATLLIDDLDTLSYFSPTLTRKPSPLPSSSTIISSLLSSAGLPSSYPPADLTTLIVSIETTSTFDTLRRNGLLLYLLIDVSTSPSVIDAFCNARLIPTFWRTSVEAYHAFDHGSYAKAMPYLSKENAEPYTELVLMRLDPREDAKLARYALQFVKVARPDVVRASKEAQQAVLISKAIGEGLAAALELARTIDPAASASTALWSWLFNKRRPKLLAEFVRLPLTPQEVQGVRQFALAPTSSSASASTAAAQRRAIDALLLRLLNAGQVIEALRLDREAEEHGLGGDEESDEASVAAVKQRREMLRLARQSLPATLRLELEEDDGDGEDGGYEGGANGRASRQQVDGAGDVSMSAAGGSRVPSRNGPALNTSRTAAIPSSPLVTLPRSASRSLALASQSPLAGIGLASSSSSFTGSPRPQPRGGPPLPRAGYASPSPRPATSALPPTAATSARQADTSMQASTSFSSSSAAAGPYARLAAQLASSQPQSAGANDSGSALLSSLLPQKRAALSSASLASRAGATSGDTMMAAAGAEGDVSMDRTMTPPPQPAAGSAFEVPKRRYVPKTSAAGEEGPQSVGRARGQRQRSQAAADGGAAKSRVARGVPSPHKKQKQMQEEEQEEEDGEDNEEEPVKERRTTTTTKARLPRSRSTMPGSFFGDDEEMHEGQQEEEPEAEQADAAKPSTRATRMAKGKQSNAAATTARRGSKDAAAAPRRKAATTSRRRRETSTTSSLAATSPSAHEDEDDATYAPPTTRRMTRSQSVMSAVSASGAAGETYDTWTSGTTGDNSARDPLYEQREEEEEEEEGDEGEDEDEENEDGQQGGRRRSRTRTSSSGSGRKTTKQPPTAGAAKRSTRQRSAQLTSSTPKASPQKRRTAAKAAAGTASATSTPRRSTRRGGP